MKKALFAATILLATGPAFAQTILPNPTAAEAGAPRPPRARGIPVSLAIEAAQTAIATCLAQGPKVTAVIVDSEGVPVVLISGDGAAAITARIATGKAMIALKTRMTSTEAAEKAKTNPALLGDLGAARPGGIPLLAGDDLVGAFGVSGAPSGLTDEGCAKAGLAKIQDRLK